MKIFVCHWTKLKERKSHLLEVLKDENIVDYEFVEEYDSDDWDINEIGNNFPNIFGKNPEGRYLKNSEISLVLKHIKIVREVAKTYDYALVLEDDVILCDNFLDEFKKSFEQLPEDWDLAWVGTCCGLHIPSIDDVRVYNTNIEEFPKNFVKGSRCTHAYAISNRGANKVLSELDYCNDGADFYYNYLIKKYNLNNYWFEPALAIQNSQFTTTIQN